MRELDTNIQFLSGIGPRRAELLKKELGIETVSDLIHLYPYRYVDRSRITPIDEATAAQTGIQIHARVVSRNLLSRKGLPLPQDGSRINFNDGQRLSVVVDDGSGQMEMVFFKALKWHWTRLVPGMDFIFFGKPSEFNGRINMVHPEVDVPDRGHITQSAITGVYPSTEKLRNGGITGKMFCRYEAEALQKALPEIEETLPDYLTGQKGLMSLKQALWNIHFPMDQKHLAGATRRLKYEELFLLQLALLKQKYVRSRGAVGFPMRKVGDDFNACFEALPYKLTRAQQKVIKEIRSDLVSGRQMNRLLQGDVGSGKTLVAVLSCLIATGNGYQSCIMAPTEVLAQQHYANIIRLLSPTNVRCELLTGSTTQKERERIHSSLEDGSSGIIVGTHALLEDNVRFHRLGLAVIDEQHRFGVEQRARLWSKSSTPPHILVMTATPIPRTLAMTLYGDLDVSVIDELPPGRKPVRTMCLSKQKRHQIYGFMRQQIAKGRQVFVVYPLIFESEKLDLENLEKGYDDISGAFPLPDYKVAIVHGKQSNEEKQLNMEAFAAGRADILVSTTVIEVGVDVPNASVMVIESAQRFGLSQLHQLRGRVGRGAEESFCILVHDDKVSKEARQRLQLIASTEDGFEIAEQDMRMRGPGDLEGTQQSGLPIKLKIASLAKDGELLGEARNDALRVLEADPDLKAPQNARLVRELRKDKYEIKDYSTIS